MHDPSRNDLPASAARRRLLRRMALAVSLAPLAARMALAVSLAPLAARMRAAAPAAMPLLAVSAPEAKAVHYVENAKDGKGAAGSSCANCALYQGANGSAQGPCQLFPGKDVKAAGWCSAWAAQM